MRTYVTVVITFLILSSVLPAFGAGEAEEFLRYGAGIRALSMGRAYVAGTRDSTAIYNNPAILSILDYTQIDIAQAQLYENYSYTYVSGAYPTIYGDNLGLEFIMLKSPSITGRDREGNITGSFEDTKISFGLGYGRQIASGWYIGVAGRGIQRDLGGSSDMYISVSAGTVYLLGDTISLGMTATNLMSFQLSGSSQDRFPMTFRGGFEYEVMRNMRIAADVFQDGSEAGYGIGAEYEALPGIKGRIGTNTYEFTVGGGIEYGSFLIDFGYSVHEELGQVMRYSIGMQMGEPVSTVKMRNSVNFFNEGKKYYQAGRYGNALESIRQAAELDPDSTVKARMVRKLKTLIREMDEIELFERYVERTPNESRLINKLVVDYLEENNSDAKDELIYLQFLLPKDKKVQKMAKIMQEEFPEESYEGKDILAEYLEEALTYYRDKKYRLVNAVCRKALNLEPSSVTAYSRMGSAYFKLGRQDLARQMWAIALQLDPANQDLRYAIEMLDGAQGQ